MKARTWVGLNSKVSLIYLRDIYAMQCFTDKQCTRVRLPLRFGGEEMGPPCPVGILLAASFCGLGGFLGAAFRAMSRRSRAPLSLSSSPSPPPGQPSPSSTRRPPFARSHLAWCSIGVGSRSRAAQIGTAGIAAVRGFRAVWWPHARPCLRRSLPPLPLAARLMPAFLVGSSLVWGRGGMLLHG